MRQQGLLTSWIELLNRASGLKRESQGISGYALPGRGATIAQDNSLSCLPKTCTMHRLRSYISACSEVWIRPWSLESEKILLVRLLPVKPL